MTEELWMKHRSVARWLNPTLWDEYLRGLEKVLGDRLIRLDVNDPVRRKADTSKSEGEFVTAFKSGENSRYIFGVFEKSRVDLEIHNFKTLGSWDNSVVLVFPEGMTLDSEIGRITDAFDLGNRLLSPFYSFADLKPVICGKKPCTPSLDISRELLGVFWLTYFGPAYQAFFGAKLSSISCARGGSAAGVTLELAPTPLRVDGDTRLRIQDQLGQETFANGGPPKERGEFALTLQQLEVMERNK